MNLPVRRAGFRQAVVAVLLLCFPLCLLGGCGSDEPAVDPAPFQAAISEYLRQKNMAMAVKQIKEGPTVSGDTATLSASLFHAELQGPTVTWQFSFKRTAGGGWRVVSHKD